MFIILLCAPCFLMMAASCIALEATTKNLSIDQEIQVTGKNISIDQMILNAGGLNALDVFHVDENGTVMVLQELDIITPLSEFRKKMASANSTRGKRIIEREELFRWPDAYVPYQICDDIKDRSQVIKDAVNEVSKYTCIKFGESETSFPRLKFHNHVDSCHANVGYRPGGFSNIYMSRSCVTTFAFVHEILHILGIDHEQRRPDRDKYVYVDEAYVNNGNYYRLPADEVNTYGIEYDYRSIMHYRYGMIARDRRYADLIGRYTVLSFRDILLLNYGYKCRAKSCPNAPRCPFGGFVIPHVAAINSTCKCYCHSGHWDNARQFVPCEYIRRSQEPVYNLPLGSSLLESEHQECMDLLDSCASYKEKGLCLTQLVRMKKLCTKTCSFCGKGQDLCMDRDESCVLMAEAGVCKDQGLETFMSNLCPKSCGKCTPISACDIQRAMEGSDIERNGSSMNSAWILNLFFLFIMCWWHTGL